MWPFPFTPLFSKIAGAIEEVAPAVVAASTTVTAATALPGNPQGDPGNCDICIENLTNGWAFCNFGDSAVTNATLTNGIGVPPTSVRIVRVDPTTGFVSVILNTGATSGNVRFTRGSGIT